MNTDDILALLLGPLGLLVGSLLLNYLLGRGYLRGKSVIGRDEYDKVVAVNATYAEKFEEQTEAIDRLSKAIDGLIAKGWARQ